MEHIRDALLKASTSQARAPSGLGDAKHASAGPTALARDMVLPDFKAWEPPSVQLSNEHLERNRIVSALMNDPIHISFNILRTRVQQFQKLNGKKSIVVTSPTQGCGKTMVSINLAFSLARLSNYKVALLDFDLKKPSVAKTLGVKACGSIGQFLQGNDEAKNCFVKVMSNFVVGLNSDRSMHSSELLHTEKMDELLNFVQTQLVPDIVLFDLPPMQGSDDVLAFLPRADTALLVVAAGVTTATEVDECEQHLSQAEKLLGIVLNKTAALQQDYYSY